MIRADGVISKSVALDLMYKKRDDLGQIVLNERGARRDKAREQRAFLERQLEIIIANARRNIRLDPRLVRLLNERTESPPTSSRASSPTRKKPSNPPAKKPPPTRADQQRPSYWYACQKMDFADLRRFIDDSLQELTIPSNTTSARPLSEKAFLELLDMLSGKFDVWDSSRGPSVPGKPPAVPEFLPSEQLRVLLEEKERLAAALAFAEADPSATKRSIKKLQRKLRLLEEETSPVEAREMQDHAKRCKAILRPHEQAKRAYKVDIQKWDDARRRRPQILRRRLEFIERIGRDIERAFKLGGAVATNRLAWQVLPPGKLNADVILRHYDKLQRLDPGVRYERERITKALSLRPRECWVGSHEWSGYIVFTFAHTQRALLECPIFGNAIYVIDSDWKLLSRLTKQDLTSHRSQEVTKIVHKGEWFRKVKRELEIR